MTSEHLKCTTTTEVLNIKFCLIFINLQLNNYIHLVATLLDNTALEKVIRKAKWWVSLATLKKA